MEPNVIHNEAANRYEIFVGERKIGHADYSRQPEHWSFVHTEVDPSERGKNYAAVLMREALADIRRTGKVKVVPVCSYVVRYMELHPETHDLLAIPIEDAVAACRLPRREG